MTGRKRAKALDRSHYITFKKNYGAMDAYHSAGMQPGGAENGGFP